MTQATYISRDEFCDLRCIDCLGLQWKRQRAVRDDRLWWLTLEVVMQFRAQAIRPVAVGEVGTRLDVLVRHAVQLTTACYLFIVIHHNNVEQATSMG